MAVETNQLQQLQNQYDLLYRQTNALQNRLDVMTIAPIRRQLEFQINVNETNLNRLQSQIVSLKNSPQSKSQETPKENSIYSFVKKVFDSIWNFFSSIFSSIFSFFSKSQS